MSYTHLDMDGNAYELKPADGLILRQVERFRRALDNEEKADILFGLLVQITYFDEYDEDDLLRTLAAFRYKLKSYYGAMAKESV